MDYWIMDYYTSLVELEAKASAMFFMLTQGTQYSAVSQSAYLQY